ncbi:MAG: laccase domain-containing protein, partial [Paracoccaceae bacterium]
YTWDQVHEEAERLEHKASDELVDRMAAVLGHPESDPHGHPIPSASGLLRPRRLPSLADLEAGVVGAAHAGWRGALAGIVEATLDAMAGLGAETGRVRAAIGPTISQRAYEVGPEFLEDFLADDPRNARFFAGGDGDRAHFDLPAFGLARLRAAGVGQAEWTRHCTYSDPARFYSFRRSTHAGEADYGRLISAIRL